MEQLLKLLENNARLTEDDLGAMLDKTPAQIHEMMELARAKGYIRGYKTLVNLQTSLCIFNLIREALCFNGKKQ